MKIGVNTWVWTSPLTIEEFTRLAAHIKRLGFDLVEVPIESTSDLDYTRAAAVAREHGLAVSACAAMSPDRDLIHPDESIRANGMAHVGTASRRHTPGPNRVCGLLRGGRPDLAGDAG
jgi:D-psicose/D-tagatose/L-ribulose 3-epimerase